MDGQIDGWIDEWMEGWTNEWMDRLIDGWMDVDTFSCLSQISVYDSSK